MKWALKGGYGPTEGRGLFRGKYRDLLKNYLTTTKFYDRTATKNCIEKRKNTRFNIKSVSVAVFFFVYSK